jgi:hypothetical protein
VLTFTSMSSSLSAVLTVKVTVPPSWVWRALATWFSEVALATAAAAPENAVPKLNSWPRSCPSTGRLAPNPALPAAAWINPGSAATA